MMNLEVARVRRMLFASSALSIVAAALGAVV
jgi:hypothetical protein